MGTGSNREECYWICRALVINADYSTSDNFMKFYLRLSFLSKMCMCKCLILSRNDLHAKMSQTEEILYNLDQTCMYAKFFNCFLHSISKSTCSKVSVCPRPSPRRKLYGLAQRYKGIAQSINKH